MTTYYKEDDTTHTAEIIKLMSKHKISPLLLDIGDGFSVTKKIRYCIDNIDGKNCSNDNFKDVLASVYPDVTLEEFCDKVTEKVTLMHSLDVCHGDLHLGNIVFEKSETGEFEVYIIDWETSFNISVEYDSDVGRFQRWIAKGFDWDRTRYELFISCEFETWKQQAYEPPC